MQRLYIFQEQRSGSAPTCLIFIFDETLQSSVITRVLLYKKMNNNNNTNQFGLLGLGLRGSRRVRDEGGTDDDDDSGEAGARRLRKPAEEGRQFFPSPPSAPFIPSKSETDFSPV